MFTNYLKIRKTKKYRQQIIKNLSEFIIVGLYPYYFQGTPKEDIKSLPLMMNGLNKRSVPRPANFGVFHFENEVLPNKKIQQFLAGELILRDEYWKRVTYKKPYWLDNYLLTGLLYDKEFERKHIIDEMLGQINDL